MTQLNKPTDTTAKSTSSSSPTLSAGACEAVPTPKGAQTEVKQAPKQAARLRVRFGLNVLNAESVCVAGTFNGWKPGATPLTEVVRGNWFKYLRLAPGRYEYHFLVDGKRVDDPTARDYVSNPDGGENAVLLVQ
jgi:1,4-alpha-glucan branching enzyme